MYFFRLIILFVIKYKMFILNLFDQVLGIGDWGLGIGDWPNPQSPIPMKTLDQINLI